jgi:hypothetical protein
VKFSYPVNVFMSQKPKAKETRYNGYLFRSRLEARWAVFFDTLGAEYYYEAEGYEVDTGIRYLPDFILPTSNMVLEVKPDTTYGSREEVEKAVTKITSFAKAYLRKNPEKGYVVSRGLPRLNPYAFLLIWNEEVGQVIIDRNAYLIQCHCKKLPYHFGATVVPDAVTRLDLSADTLKLVTTPELKKAYERAKNYQF